MCKGYVLYRALVLLLNNSDHIILVILCEKKDKSCRYENTHTEGYALHGGRPPY